MRRRAAPIVALFAAMLALPTWSPFWRNVSAANVN
jgi:hypothetical protein